jgi:integrase
MASQALLKARVALMDGTRSARFSEGLYTVAKGFDRAIEGSWLINSDEQTKRQARSGIQMLNKTGYLPFNTPVGSIDRQSMAKLQRDLLDSGLKPATVNLRFWIVRAVLEQAVLDGAIREVPVLPKKLSVKGNKRVRYITREEEALITDRLATQGNQHLLDLFTIMMDTGLRIYEAVRIDEAVYHGPRGVVVIPAEWSKNGDRRTVPLTGRTKAIIERRLADGQGYTFPVPLNTAPRYWVSRFEREWAALRADMGLPEELVLHSARHTLATRLFEVGTDVRTAMAWMGHRTASITMDYAKATDQATKNALGRLDAMVNGTSSEDKA